MYRFSPRSILGMDALNRIPCLALMVMMIALAETFLQGEQENLPHPFHMTLTPAQIVPTVTKDVALRCEDNPEAVKGHVLRKVSSIRIVKKDSQDEWQVVAVQTRTGEPRLARDQISASGRLIPGVVQATFLEVRWPVADQDTFGVYRCDVFGTDEDNESDVEMTKEVELKQGDVPIEDLISLLVQTKLDIESLIAKNSRDIDKLSVQKYSTAQDIDKNKTLFNKEFLLRRTAVAWPAGRYALLQPESGCPVDLAFFGGNSGYVRLHTESTDDHNNNSVHAHTHLSQPVITQSGSNVFFYLRFCVVTRVFSDTPWPVGSYCIHAKGKQCPDGFSHGKIFLDTEDHQNADMFEGNVPFLSPSELLFCCRNDTAGQTRVSLPTESPFYLYRLGGQCQQVDGMDVMEEFLEVHTENFVNQNSVAGTVPDSHLGLDSVVRIELCYYSKK